MEGRCAGVETSPSPFSSAASPPREVGGQSRSSVVFGSVLKKNSLPTTGSQTTSQLGE